MTIGEVYEGYFNDAEEGVVGYAGKRIFALVSGIRFGRKLR